MTLASNFSLNVILFSSIKPYGSLVDKNIVSLLNLDLTLFKSIGVLIQGFAMALTFLLSKFANLNQPAIKIVFPILHYLQ